MPRVRCAGLRGAPLPITWQVGTTPTIADPQGAGLRGIRMTGFEALFAFYALLLGLALGNVSHAFADMYRLRARMPVGWTMPLLGVVVILAVCQQWMSLFLAQGRVQLGGAQILASLIGALPYIVIGRLMIPHEGEARDVESHYAAQRGLLAGMLLVPVLSSLVFNLIFDVMEGASIIENLPGYAMYHGARIAFIAPMLVWRSVVVQRVGLSLLGIYLLLIMVF